VRERVIGELMERTTLADLFKDMVQMTKSALEARQ
jgi:hypothetical protein